MTRIGGIANNAHNIAATSQVPSAQAATEIDSFEGVRSSPWRTKNKYGADQDSGSYSKGGKGFPAEPVQGKPLPAEPVQGKPLPAEPVQGKGADQGADQSFGRPAVVVE